MAEFTQNGYTDLEELTADLCESINPELGRTPEQFKETVAAVCQALLMRLPMLATRERKERELYMAVRGIVDCAEEDGLI